MHHCPQAAHSALVLADNNAVHQTASQPHSSSVDDFDQLLGGPTYRSHNSSQASIHQEGDDLLSGFSSSGPISQAASNRGPVRAPAAQADPFDMFQTPSGAERQHSQQPDLQQQSSSDLLQGFGDFGEAQIYHL